TRGGHLLEAHVWPTLEGVVSAWHKPVGRKRPPDRAVPARPVRRGARPLEFRATKESWCVQLDEMGVGEGPGGPGRQPLADGGPVRRPAGDGGLPLVDEPPRRRGAEQPLSLLDPPGRDRMVRAGPGGRPQRCRQRAPSPARGGGTTPGSTPEARL